MQHKSPNSKDLKHLLPMNLFVTQMLERKWPIKSHCINFGMLDIHTLFKKSSKKKIETNSMYILKPTAVNGITML